MTPPDADADVIDRLYAGGSDDDLDGLRMVRGLVARVRDEMPELEPPQAVSALLLQAAAPARVATPAKTGAWARLRGWFAGIAMHPGLAAAATLIVVAGAAAIWMRQGGKAATPTVASTAPAVEDKAAPPPAALDDGLAKDEAVVVEREGATQAEELDVRPADKPAPRKTKPKGAPKSGGESAGSSTPIVSEPDDADDEEKPTVTTKVGGNKVAEDKPESPPPPPPKNPEVWNPPANDSPTTGGSSDADQARKLTTAAAAAARRGECATVDTLAGRVKTLDPGYYRSDFEPQPDIKACRAARK